MSPARRSRRSETFPQSRICPSVLAAALKAPMRAMKVTGRSAFSRR
jgi:hypothetical protein